MIPTPRRKRSTKASTSRSRLPRKSSRCTTRSSVRPTSRRCCGNAPTWCRCRARASSCSKRRARPRSGSTGRTTTRTPRNGSRSAGWKSPPGRLTGTRPTLRSCSLLRYLSRKTNRLGSGTQEKVWGRERERRRVQNRTVPLCLPCQGPLSRPESTRWHHTCPTQSRFSSNINSNNNNSSSSSSSSNNNNSSSSSNNNKR